MNRLLLHSTKVLTRVSGLDMKLPGGWIWVTIGSSGSLGSVEFLEVVGDDLEVAPAEKFEAEV